MTQNSSVSRPLVEKIRETVNKVAREEGYDLVLDRASGAVIYWKDEHDLTQRVLIELNKNYPKYFLNKIAFGLLRGLRQILGKFAA